MDIAGDKYCYNCGRQKTFGLIGREKYIYIERENTLSGGYVPVLSKFAPSSCYTQQRLSKKNVATCVYTESCRHW